MTTVADLVLQLLQCCGRFEQTSRCHGQTLEYYLQLNKNCCRSKSGVQKHSQMSALFAGTLSHLC